MRGISVFFYSMKQGFISLIKNRMFSVVSICTVTACLFLFGIFYFVISNFQNIIHTAETTVGISVFFEEGITSEMIHSIGEEIKNREEVSRIEYISAEQAWETFKEENFKNSPELVESFGEDNPLADSASYHVFLHDIEQQDTVVECLKIVEGVREVKRSDQIAKSLININKLVGIVSAVLIFVLLLVSVFLIHSTISTGIAVRKQEISIMRLLGASDFFIWGPFIVEGIVIGFFGSVIPLLLLWFAYGRIINYITSHFSILANGISFIMTGEMFSVLVPLSIGLGVGIGFLGSFITVRKNLNV